MAIVNLNGETKAIITGKDNVVIRDVFETIRGGRTLDVAGYPLDVINAGHLAIKETATGEFKPMPLNAAGDGYAELTAGHEYAGVIIQSKETKDPRVGIMIRGSVNPKAAPFDMTSILTAVKAALPLITFLAD